MLQLTLSLSVDRQPTVAAAKNAAPLLLLLLFLLFLCSPPTEKMIWEILLEQTIACVCQRVHVCSFHVTGVYRVLPVFTVDQSHRAE